MSALCKACGKRAVHNAPVARSSQVLAEDLLLCAACRKFFFRNKKQFQDQEVRQACTCFQQQDSRTYCTICRFRKCEEIFENRKQMTMNDEIGDITSDFSKVPCAVCSQPSNGYHFGAITCEGCKGFFRRYVNGIFKFQCKCKSDTSPSPSLKRNSPPLCPIEASCRKCRLKRCFSAGMSKNAISLGRHSVLRRAEMNATVKQRRSSNASMASPSMVSPNSVPESAASQNPISEPGPSHLAPGQALPLVDETQINNFIIDQVVKAVAYLAPITSTKIGFTSSTSFVEVFRSRLQSVDLYVSSVGNFINQLPFVDQVIPVRDKQLLFLSSVTPLVMAQLSLDFDVANQVPNFFSLERGETRQIVRYFTPDFDKIEQFLVVAGNALVKTVCCITEFAMFCALLFLNEEINVENSENCSRLRVRYITAFAGYLQRQHGMNAAERMRQVSNMVLLYRLGTPIVQSVFSKPKLAWPDMTEQIVSLSESDGKMAMANKCGLFFQQ